MSQRKIIHIDMDCFYAAIEMRDNPKLHNKPIAVGGDAAQRGVLCTSNYIARQYGVRSAMATAYAIKLCPHLIIIPPNMKKYHAVSKEIFKIFQEYTPRIEPLSLDEAFLDVSDSNQCQGSASLIANAIREKIKVTQNLTASAGIAPNKFLAKIASDWNKPDGQYVIPPQKIDHFILEVPVEKIFGVGKVTAHKMKNLNLNNCGDLQKLTLIELAQHFGSFGERLYYLCRGMDERPVEPDRVRKSVSVEHTFTQDLYNDEACLPQLNDLFQDLKQRLLKYSARTIHKQFVKIKFYDFHQTTVECLTQSANIDIYTNLLREGYTRYQRPIRLIGLGVVFLEENSHHEQLSFII